MNTEESRKVSSDQHREDMQTEDIMKSDAYISKAQEAFQQAFIAVQSASQEGHMTPEVRHQDSRPLAVPNTEDKARSSQRPQAAEEPSQANSRDEIIDDLDAFIQGMDDLDSFEIEDQERVDVQVTENKTENKNENIEGQPRVFVSNADIKQSNLSIGDIANTAKVDVSSRIDAIGKLVARYAEQVVVNKETMSVAIDIRHIPELSGMQMQISNQNGGISIAIEGEGAQDAAGLLLMQQAMPEIENTLSALDIALVSVLFQGSEIKTAGEEFQAEGQASYDGDLSDSDEDPQADNSDS